MDWLAHIDAYCERMGPGLWAEPLNAVTNAAFLIAAYVMWRRVRGLDDRSVAPPPACRATGAAVNAKRPCN